MLGNRRNLSSKKLGSVLKEVLDHHTLRGKFCSVHPGLVQEGVNRVEVGVEGLHFIRNSGLPLISVFTTFLSKVSLKQGTQDCPKAEAMTPFHGEQLKSGLRYALALLALLLAPV